MLCARVWRYAIDLNRPAIGGESLYPGQAITGLCPVDTFRSSALYREGRSPDAAEVKRRIAMYWWPYHAAVRGELDRLRAQYPHVLL